MIHTASHTASSAVAQPMGLQAGTQVLTLKGARAVEDLKAGDRIITRTGACPLRDLMMAPSGGFMLAFDTPQVILLADGHIHSETGLPFAA